MNKTILCRLAVVLSLALGLASCGTNQGTEVVSPPNPSESIVGKQALIVPSTGDEMYRARFFEDVVLVDQRLKAGSSLTLDTQSAAYTLEDSEITFEVTFDDGRTVSIRMVLDAEDEPTAVFASIDEGEEEEAEFTVTDIPEPLACSFDISNAAAARALIRDLNEQPYSAQVLAAFADGCDSSTSDFEGFIEGFLCSLEIDPSLATDAGIQDEIDNYEDVDDADFNDGDAAEAGETCS